jgi:hypothetical protein
MDHRSAYVFNTLSTPHGACTLPGEDIAERCYRALDDAEGAVAEGDVSALTEAVGRTGHIDVPDDVPPALRAAIAEMVKVAETAHRMPERVCGDLADEWSASSRAARSRVVRMSIELRLVVSVAA